MRIELRNRIKLDEVPSASGIEILNEFIFVVGDNSSFLFELNANFTVIAKSQIYSADFLENGVLAKQIKPDFEAITRVVGCDPYNFYIFGSGSKSPIRDVLVKVDAYNQKNIKHYSLSKFYDLIKRECGLLDEQLNIEAAVATDEEMFLFNRGKNCIIQFNIKAFNTFLENKEVGLNIKTHEFFLPQINTIVAGFSGASLIPTQNKIIFTASVENTKNWIDDGAVLGSFVGIIELDQLGKNVTPHCFPLLEKEDYIKLKIESVAPLSIIENRLTLLLVSDSDGSDSEILTIEIILPNLPTDLS